MRRPSVRLFFFLLVKEKGDRGLRALQAPSSFVHKLFQHMNERRSPRPQPSVDGWRLQAAGLRALAHGYLLFTSFLLTSVDVRPEATRKKDKRSEPSSIPSVDLG